MRVMMGADNNITLTSFSTGSLKNTCPAHNYTNPTTNGSVMQIDKNEDRKMLKWMEEE